MQLQQNSIGALQQLVAVVHGPKQSNRIPSSHVNVNGPLAVHRCVA